MKYTRCDVDARTACSTALLGGDVGWLVIASIASGRRDCFMPKLLHKELSADIHLLGDLLGKVIRRQAGVEIFELEERFRALSKVRRQDRERAGEIAAKLSDLVASLTSSKFARSRG
jgi:hypothetical protein